MLHTVTLKAQDHVLRHQPGAYLASMRSRSSCSFVSLPASFLRALSCPLALLSTAACSQQDFVDEDVAASTK